MKFFIKISAFFVLVSAVLTSANLFAADGFIDVNADGVVGHYFPAANGSTNYPVLVLGGAEGGFPDELAAPMIKAGFPVLSLAYFKAPKLPDELNKIPLEYVDTAASWLLSQEGIAKKEFIVVAWSKGAELALLLASRDQRVAQVVAIAPSSVVWAGILKDWTKVPGSSWTEGGQELSHVPFKSSGEIRGLLDLYSQSLENRVDNGAANIPVEKIRGTAILLTGSKDEIWPSKDMANTACQRMNQASTKHKENEKACRHLNYPELDHLLDSKFLDESDSLYADFISLLKR